MFLLAYCIIFPHTFQAFTFSLTLQFVTSFLLFWCLNSRLGRPFGCSQCLTVGFSSETLARCRISIKLPSVENSASRLLTADMLTLAAAAAALFSESIFACPGFNSFCPCFSLLPTEQIFQNLRQEYSRIQRRRQLEVAFNQTEACSSSDAPSPSSSLNAPSSPPGRHISCWLHTCINGCLLLLLQKAVSSSHAQLEYGCSMFFSCQTTK